MFPQPLMNHTIIQMAYVVRDIRETAKDWQETFGIGPFFLLEDINITDPHYRGKPQEVDFSVAVCQTGDIHVEFIQQNCDSPSCYRDMFAAGEEGFHHVGIVPDIVDCLAEEMVLSFYDIIGDPKKGLSRP